MSWEDVAAVAQEWAAAREPRVADVPLVLFRDANSWCPHCHKVFFYMEQKRLRYMTERIHLQGDPREPPKQEWFLRDISPGGGVPALKICDEVILESLDILRRLDKEFPDDVTIVAPEDEWVQHVIDSSAAFDCDGDRWLQNLSEADEDELRMESRCRLDWLEGTLATHGGPFFLGNKPSIIDAAYVGFLTRVETNYRFFKKLDVRAPSASCPRFAAWLAAIEKTRGGMATWQTPGTDQRVMQAHPARRAAAEPCMGLHPTRLGVGEDPDWAGRLLAVAAQPVPLAIGSCASMEAAWRLYERRTPLADFLLRKAFEYAAGESYWQGKRHPKSGGRDWEVLREGGEATDSSGSGGARQWHWRGRDPPPYGPTDQNHRWPAPNEASPVEDLAWTVQHVEGQLLLVASKLVGLDVTAASVGARSEEDQDRQHDDDHPLISDSSPVALLGGLIGTPRDMSAAAAAQVQAALRDLISSQSVSVAATL